VEIGFGILPIYSRTPTLTAMTAAGWTRCPAAARCSASARPAAGHRGLARRALRQAAGPHPRDRGDLSLGVAPRGRCSTRASTTCRCRPARAPASGKPLKLINHPVRERIPIWLAALGDKNVEMAAEIAEGWLPFVLYPEKLDAVWGDSLRAGKAKRAPELGELQMTGGGMLAIEDEFVGHARAAARGLSSLYIGGMGARARTSTTPFPALRLPGRGGTVQDLYLDGKKGRAAAALPESSSRTPT